jgi:hypothetical protein
MIGRVRVQPNFKRRKRTNEEQHEVNQQESVCQSNGDETEYGEYNIQTLVSSGSFSILSHLIVVNFVIYVFVAVSNKEFGIPSPS